MQKYKIDGMLCPHSQKSVGTAIANLPGVEMVDIDIERGEIAVDGEVMPDKVMTAVAALGYQIIPIA